MRRTCVTFLLIALAAATAGAADKFVWTNSPHPGAPYNAWTNAARTIQDAVDAAGSGDTVWVTNGVYGTGTRPTPGYACSNRVVITNSLLVRSVNGPTATFIVGSPDPWGGNGNEAVRCVYISAGLLSGFTLTNGHVRGSGDADHDQSGGAAWAQGATLSNCILTGNAAWRGGGVFRGTLHNCVLLENRVSDDGGGAYIAELNNCALAGNVAWRGGGAFESRLNNCTLTDNAAQYGGGTCRSTNFNCVLYYNSANDLGPNWQASELSYCCTTPHPGGTGNITNEPLLFSSSHLRAGSPCVATGSAAYVSGADLDGQAWADPPAMGCDEPGGPYQGPLAAGIVAAGHPYYKTNTAIGFPLTFRSDIIGSASSNLWTFGDGAGIRDAAYATHAWSAGGTYEVVLRAYSADHPAGVAVTTVVQVATGQTFYVDILNPSPAAPYTNWTTAATNIQDAVDEAEKALWGFVLVSNGVYQTGARITPGYALSNRVVITNHIVLQSVNGPSNTVIAGSPGTGGFPGTGAVRCVYMTAGLLAGFTLTNGQTYTTGNDVNDRSGGGAWAEGATVTNCVITGNRASFHGGGVYKGMCRDCRVIGNHAWKGGGAYDAVLLNCDIMYNASTSDGGGVRSGVLSNCVVAANSAPSSYYGATGGGASGALLVDCIVWSNNAYVGGGAGEGRLENCLIATNSAQYGGGVYGATVVGCVLTGNASSGQGGGSSFGVLDRCTIVNNHSYDGGGACQAVLTNCVLSRNYAGRYGGGAYACTLVNCTLVTNLAWSTGGGAYNSQSRNCILHQNAMHVGWNNVAYGTSTYSCVFPDFGGDGNITNEPQFVDAGAGDFRLADGCLCIDAAEDIGLDADRDGIPRPLDGDGNGSAAPDIGAYELASAASDTDNDGLDDYGELVADTDPLDAGSTFEMLDLDIGPDSAGIHWQGGASVRQYVEYCTNLLSPQEWFAVYTNDPPTLITNLFLHAGVTNDVLYYRVRAKR